MRHLSRFSFLLAGALIILSSCAREIAITPIQSESHTVNFVASVDQTKTTVSVNGSVASYSWKAKGVSVLNDEDPAKFSVYESGVKGTTTAAVLVDGKMCITASFAGDSAPAGAKYSAMFNTGVRKNQDSIDAEYDQQSDVLISSEVSNAGRNDTFEFSFGRLATVNSVKLYDINNGSYLKQVIIESVDGQPLAGDFDYSTKSFVNTSSVLNITSFNEITDGSVIFNFVSLPIENSTLKFTVVTTEDLDNVSAVYEKKFTTPISFVRGKYKQFGVANFNDYSTFDLTTNTTKTLTESEISWSNGLVTISDVKGEATTATNNYVGGVGTASSTRFYKDSNLKISAVEGISISKVVFYATTAGYATALSKSTWNNVYSHEANNQEVTIVPTSGTDDITATIGATCGFEDIKVYYGAPTVEDVYTITVNPVSHGSLTTDVTSSLSGKTITMTIVPDSGYMLNSLSVKNASTNEDIAHTKTSFVMPNANVIISAEFSLIPTKTLDFECNLNTTTFGCDAGNNGEEQSFTANNITFVAGCLSSASNKTYYSSDLVKFYKDSYLVISVPVGYAIVGIEFGEPSSDKKWDDSNIGKTWSGAENEVTFSFAAQCRIVKAIVTVANDSFEPEYTVSCSSVTGGTLKSSVTKAKAGAEVSLTAEPSDGYHFNNDWAVKGADNADVAVTEGKFTMPAKNVTVSGTFSKTEYTITKTAVEHGSFTVKVNDAEVSKATKGDVVVLDYTPVDGYDFSSWSVKKTDTDEAVTVYSTNKFTMPAADVTVTANIVAAAAIPTYASLAELVAAGAPTTDGTLVTVTLTNEEITKMYVSGSYTNGVYFQSGSNEVLVYCQNTPSSWTVGGYVSGTLTKCSWKLYKTTWELCPDSYDELTCNAPCATPVITLSGAQASVSCATNGATIRYTVGESPADPTEESTVYSTPLTLTDGQTIKAKAFKAGCKASAVASKKYTASSGSAKTKDTETPKYTLTPSKGSNSAYTSNCDVTIGDITWNVTGNAQMTPWRIGGKSLSGVDRTVYSKTAFAAALWKVTLDVGAADKITVNSLKLVYSENADFSDSVSIDGEFAANSTISFEADFPENCYFKFVFNVTVSGSSNKFLEFSGCKFWGYED